MSAVAHPESMSLSEAIETVGARALGYVLDTSPEHLSAHAAGVVVLTTTQQRALDAALRALGDAVAYTPPGSEGRAQSARGLFGSLDSDQGSTVGTYLRQQAGGALEAISASDPVSDALAHLARDRVARPYRLTSV